MFGPKAMKGFFGWGHRPGFGHGPRRRRMFEKGDLKYVILDLLKDEPSHGYAPTARRHGVRGRHPAGRQESLRHHG
jgi:hypothetical protein